MNTESIMLSEISWREQDKDHTFHLYIESETNKQNRNDLIDT